MMMQWILIAVCFAYATIAHADCEDCNDTQIVSLEQKFYVHPHQICFTQEAIYVEADGIIYETPAVHLDETGYYIDQVKRSCCFWFQWKCSRCRRCNIKGLDWKCKRCKKPIEK